MVSVPSWVRSTIGCEVILDTDDILWTGTDGDDLDGEKPDPIQALISAYEIEAFGLEESRVFFLGRHIDAHIMVGGGKQIANFSARVFNLSDGDGSLPVLVGMRRYNQNWETGGCYLQPQEGWPVLGS